MWRNISWNSTDSTLPEGMHRHETGPYFKTPSIQSASSSQSGAAGTTAATVAVAPPITMSVIVAGQAPPAPELHTSAQLAAEESEQATKQSSFECMGATSQTGSSRQAPQAVSSMLELVSAHSPGRRDSSCETDTLSQQAPSSQQQQASKAAAAATPTQPPQQQQRRTRFKDTPRQMSSSAGATPSTSNSTSQRNSGQCHQQPNPAGASHHQGFRSRLSSISGALQHPKLTRRFFSGHGGDSSDQHHEGSNHHLPHQASTVQITTTSIESPQHGSARDTAFGACVMGESEARPLTSSSGRRLSQLFLPHMGQNCILNQMQDPYASNELIPPHLLGLYGQPPLVGASGQPSQGGHRASWADTSLFGRLSNVRHSIDSGYQGAGQMRHSFDARSEQCNEQDNEDRPNCVQIMKKLFFSLVLGTLIAICWVMIIHTLKWIAIRGNEFEELQQLQAASLQPQLPSSSNYNQLTGNIHQANLLLAHQTVQERQAAGVAASSPRDPASAQSEGTNVSAASTPTSSTLGPQLFSVDADQSRRRRRRRRGGERARQQGEAHAEAMSAPDEIKPTTTQTNKIRPKRRPASRHEQPGGATENDNDDDWSLSGASFVPAAGAGAHSQGAAGRALLATSNIDEDSRPRRVMSLGERRRHNSNLADRQQQQQTRARAQQTHKQQQQQQQQQQEPRGDLGELAAGDENDELDSSASRNDLTSTIMSTGALGLEAQQSINDGNNSPQQSQQTNGNEADLSDSSMVPPATHLADGSSAIERSSPMDATAATTQALIYKAPFFTSWFVSIWNIAFMPVFTIISSCCFRNEESTTKKLLAESISQFMDNGLTTLQFLGRCAFFSVLWIGTIFGIVYSLAYLEATLVMALFACSPALVYLLSWVLLHQQFVGVRIVAVIICTTGIALLAYMDNSRTLGSVLIVAGSALCSAVYKVIYQRMFGFWSIAQMSLFFTLIGLFNAFLMWPIALLLYFLGVELIAWRHIPWFHLIAAGALHLTANVVAYFGPICSYDIFLTLGLLFAVVLSAVIDVTFYKITFFGMKLAGVLLLMIGFLVCLLPENWNEYLYDLANERFIRWKKQRSLKKSRNKVQDMSTGQMSRLRTPSGRVK